MDPECSDVDNMTTSAGILYLACISIISPTCISSALIFFVSPFLIILYTEEFDYLSLLYLLKSSYAYLPNVNNITIINGERYVKRKPIKEKNIKEICYRLLILGPVEISLWLIGKS